ncbi:MAG: hypothetical protein H6618_03295 [Deltaproteobacteria bacterium]|nr:hypothetical protein [Deltaproteobacteria bacterium]
MIKKLSLIFCLLILVISCHGEGNTAPEDKPQEPGNQEMPVTTTVAPENNSRLASPLPPKALLLAPSPVTLWEDQAGEQEGGTALCQIPADSRMVIVSQEAEWYQVRIDRTFDHGSSGCPAEVSHAWVRQQDAGKPEVDDALLPRRLAMDLKVFSSEEISDATYVCTLAKGLLLLLTKETPQKIQIPKSPYCDPEHPFVSFKHRPGLWSNP